jgi:hypothetical protein
LQNKVNKDHNSSRGKGFKGWALPWNSLPTATRHLPLIPTTPTFVPLLYDTNNLDGVLLLLLVCRLTAADKDLSLELEANNRLSEQAE